MQALLHLTDLIKKTVPPIHKEGHFFIVLAAVATFLLGLLSAFLGWFGFIIVLWMVYFFRDPIRVTPIGDELVISPADGLVSLIEMDIKAPEELGLGAMLFNRVSIFLNVFDVHVNRVPISGKVKALNYRPGKFLSADMDKASSDNERQSFVVETSKGKTLVCIQIAGMVARRIVCDLQDNQQIVAGERYGIIRFGSRVDVYLPQETQPQVVIGQRMVGGETIIADLSQSMEARQGIAS